MDAVILCEFAVGREHLRAAILARLAQLALRGEAQLGFVATEQGEPGAQGSEIIAINLKSAALAGTILRRWQSEAVLADLVTMRMLRIEPVRAVDMPLAMFP